MPRQEQFRVVPTDGFQCAPLIAEEIQREACVEFRVVQSPLFELWILIVLDEVVIGIPGKGEGVQLQGIDGRQFQQPEVRISRRPDAAGRRQSGYVRAGSRHR